MTGYILPGILGLLTGLTMRWTGLATPPGLRRAWGLYRSHSVRSALYAVGFSMALTALLCWLAVIDVDRIAVLPLHGGVLLGGVIYGVASALCGYTPGTAFAGLGSHTPGQAGYALEALCTVTGCLGAAALLPVLSEPLAHLTALPPHSDATLFRMTLDEPWLLGGGFIGQALAGCLLMGIAACIPGPRRLVLTDAPTPAETPVPVTAEATEAANAPTEGALSGEEATVGESASNDTDAPLAVDAPTEDDSPAEDEVGAAQYDADSSTTDEPADTPSPASAPEDAFVAILPGEEPLVVDTALIPTYEEDAEPGGAEPDGEDIAAPDEPPLPDN